MGRVRSNGDGFDGCLAPPGWVKRARREFEVLPGPVRDHPHLPRWLAADIRHYWSMVQASAELRAERAAADERDEVRKRDVDAVLTAIARLERALRRLPRNSMGSVQGDRMAEEWRARMPGATLVSSGYGSRRTDYLRSLAVMRETVQSRLVRRRRPGPRPDHWRLELEHRVARDLADAGLRLTRGRLGVLAKTLGVVYAAAGINTPEQDSLFAILQRLVR